MTSTNTNKRLCVHRTPSSSSLESNNNEDANMTTTTTTSTSTAVNPTALAAQLTSLLQSNTPNTNAPADEISTKRLSYYLEHAILSTKSSNPTLASTSTTRAKDLLRTLHPTSSETYREFIHATKSAYYARKHSLPPTYTKNLLESTPITSLSAEELKELSLTPKACYYLHLSMCLLELGEVDRAEEMGNAALKLVQREGGVAGGQKGYFEYCVYFVLTMGFVKRGDMVEAGFWKGLLPKGWEVPEMLWVREVEKGEWESVEVGDVGFDGSMGWGVPEAVSAASAASAPVSRGDALKERWEKDLGDIWDTVSQNYRELCERIKSIHKIMDEKEKSDGEKKKEEEKKVRRVGILKTDNGAAKTAAGGVVINGAPAVSSAELEELKRKVEYLERTLLR